MQSNLIEKIHNEVQAVVKRYKSCEVELIEILQKADAHKVHYTLGFSSLFKYALSLGLSEEIAYIFINVARKAKEVPQLKEEIKKGSISMSKAKRLTAVLKPENQNHWLELAKTATKQELEKQVALASPRIAIPEKVSFVSPETQLPEKATTKFFNEARVQLQIGISEELLQLLRRAQDIESQNRQKPATLEDTLEAMLKVFLSRKDPLEKAKRQLERKNIQGPGPVGLADAASRDGSISRRKIQPQEERVPHSSRILRKKLTNRAPITSLLKKQIYLKYEGKCGHSDSEGKRCNERRFLHIHHLRPVSRGGENILENLELLCAGHHRAEHHPR